MENDFYVYLYLDPRREGRFLYEDFSLLYEPFYVGKGKGCRYKRIDNRPDYFKKILHEIEQSGFNPIVFKIRENLSEDDSFILEISLIHNIGRKDLDKGPLINLTNGGEGGSGYKWTDEQLKERRVDFKIIKQEFKDRDYTLLSKEEDYVNCTTKLKYKHNQCGAEHEISWKSFHTDKQGCPKCGKEQANEKLKMDWDVIVKTFINRGYELKSTKNEYINCYSKLRYKHKKCETEHEIRWIYFNYYNQGCPVCGRNEAAEKRKTDWDLVVKTFEERGYELLSTKDEYENAHSKLKYKHKKCGTEHEIRWNDFYNNDHGCPMCGNEEVHKKLRKDFNEIIKVFKYFNYKLLSTEDDYKNYETKLEYIDNYGKIKTIRYVSIYSKYKKYIKKQNKENPNVE